MARWRPLTWHYLSYFDGCGFAKYYYIALRLALLMPSTRLIICWFGVRIPAGAPINWRVVLHLRRRVVWQAVFPHNQEWGQV
jgi:hypothetical protein